MKVFVDTNVLLDVLAKREDFYDDSAEVWTLAETGRITGFISTLSLANLYYILRRADGAKASRKNLRLVRDIFTLITFDTQIANQAIDSEIADFEDGIQFFSALRAGATTLITRNTKDFPATDLAIQTPTQFLSTHFPRDQRSQAK
jgi:predicted nucleic acid-binding protein